MSTDSELRSSVSEEAALELLLGAGLDKNRRSSSWTTGRSRAPLRRYPRFEAGETEANQSVQPTSAFERSVMTALEKMGQRLDDLSARVEGPSNRELTPLANRDLTPPGTSSSASTTQTGLRRNWVDIPVEETPNYSIPVVWDDEESGPDTTG